MSNSIKIIKFNGQMTPNIMPQATAEKYLCKLLHQNLHSNLKQSMNDVVIGRGKATSNYYYNRFPVLHASSGNAKAGHSVTLFYYDFHNIHYIIAMGEHTGSSTYKLVFYGQPVGDFKDGATITL